MARNDPQTPHFPESSQTVNDTLFGEENDGLDDQERRLQPVAEFATDPANLTDDGDIFGSFFGHLSTRLPTCEQVS